MASEQASDGQGRGSSTADTRPGEPPQSARLEQHDGLAQSQPSPSRARRPHLPADESAFGPRPHVAFADEAPPRPPAESSLSPTNADRIFPIRSVVTVDPTPTPAQRHDRSQYGSYFHQGRRQSHPGPDFSQQQQRNASNASSIAERSTASIPPTPDEVNRASRQSSVASTQPPTPLSPPAHTSSIAPQYLNEIMADTGSREESRSRPGSERPRSRRTASMKSGTGSVDETGPLVTARFKHVVSEGGHAIITGRDGETLQRCEDEPIHIPGAVQGFGLLIALEEAQEGKLIVRVVSENAKQLIGYTPKQLFALDSFTDILSEDQADNLLDHVDFIRDEDADVVTNGPEVFTLAVRQPGRRTQKFWCAMHISERNPNLVICEFELEDDPVNPLVPPNNATPEPPEDTLDSQPTAEEYQESTHNSSKPLRVLRSARKRKGEAAAMEVFNIMSQVQEQLAAAPNLEKFLKILVGVVKELTGFHRVMVYQFDQSWNGRVVTELVDPRATKDLYKGLNFPASDIPKQARDLYKVNKVRMLYDRDQETARLVCRTMEDLETPLDLTHSYLRAMSPIHLKYLGNMAVRSSMSISINAFEELWGLIACHSYGSKGMRVSFPIRKMCRLVGDSASRNIERLSYASRLQARKLINTVPTQSNPSGYIIASSEDLLKLFDADFGLLSIRDETKILGRLEQSQEALAMLEYLRMRRITNVMTSQDIKEDFPDLRYAPGFQVVAGLLLVPLSAAGQDFIVFFRKGQLREVKWAGNPYEKFVKEGTEGYLEPRKSFRTWSEMVVGKCREWTEEEIETAAVLCLVYGKFIEVWRQKEAALQNSQLTRLLLANSAHEVRTPLNAIINYLEIALEGSLDQETRDNLAKSHSASKSLIYVINDLLDLTKTEEGGDLVKDEIFELAGTLVEATTMFKNDAKRKDITYEVSVLPNLPTTVIGDQRRVRQAISNVTANAIQNTSKGGVQVEMYLVSREETRCEVEVSIADTGSGMSSKKLDQLFRELEQVQSEFDGTPDADLLSGTKALPESGNKGEERCLGLGLAVVARIIRNMNGQLRLKSEEGRGSRFVMQFPFDIPDSEPKQRALEGGESSVGSVTPQADDPSSPPVPVPQGEEVTLIRRDSNNQRRSSAEFARNQMSRKNSAESVASKLSVNSKLSAHSVKSGLSNLSYSSQISNKSEADRLIEAIQEPYRVEGHTPHRSGSARASISSSAGPRIRPPLEKRHTTATVETLGNSAGSSRDRPKSIDSLPADPSGQVSRAGEQLVADQGMPLRPVRVPDDFIVSASGGLESSSSTAAQIAPQHQSQQIPDDLQSQPSEVGGMTPKMGLAENMRVLVAEDDPVNSRIIKKRLEKLGHDVVLTVNGEDCASTYCEKSEVFDIVLMDMQMPIVDGLTSTKMIRSFEKSHPTHTLSPRASLNGRIPIIAVSASLIERERQTYIDGGFDGWILKPISFNRMTVIMTGIVDGSVRRENLYCAGAWEHGGWFDEAHHLPAADTVPSGEPPVHAAGTSAASGEPPQSVRDAAKTDNPAVKEDADSVQTREQNRLLESQARQQAQAQDQPQQPPHQQEQAYTRLPPLLSKASSMPETSGVDAFELRNQDENDRPTVAVLADQERVNSPDAVVEGFPPAAHPAATGDS